MRDVKINRKYCRTGMDTFEFTITLEGMEDISFEEEKLPNANGKSIVTIICNAGKIKGSISAVHCIRNTNEKPFGLSDCVKMDLVRCRVFDFIREKLKEHLGERYTESFFEESRVTSLEVNVTLPCQGKATAADMSHFFDMVFDRTTVYRKRKPGSKCEKDDTGIGYKKAHCYFVKQYDKQDDFDRQDLELTDSNVFRLEIVFKERKLDSMFGKNKRTIENILSANSLDIMCREYKCVLEEIIKQNVKPYLSNCVEMLYQSLMDNNGGKQIVDTICRYKEIIVDIECLRRALHKWYAKRQEHDPVVKDCTDEMIYKCRKKNLGIAEDVLISFRALHEAAG